MSNLSGANQVDTLNGHYKETYADKLLNLVPEGLVCLNLINFLKSDKSPGNFN